LASTQSPSKSVQSAILMALAGVISIGISPGTLAIVVSSTSANLADLMGLAAPATAEAKPAGDLSSPRETTRAEVSYSGLLTDGLSLLQAALDETLPDTASSPAISGLSPNLGSLGGAGFSSFGGSSVGPVASLNNFGGLGGPVSGTSTSTASTAPTALAVESGECANSTSGSCEVNVTVGDGPLPSTADDIVVQADDVATPSPAAIDPQSIITQAAAEDAPDPSGATPGDQVIRPAQDEVPAPATLLLFLAGLPGLWMLRRRGRSTRQA
jgi:hypothetical protein